MSNIEVISHTQRIEVDLATSAISIVNAGPPGPPGVDGDPGFVAQPDEPINRNMLWIDTDDNMPLSPSSGVEQLVPDFVGQIRAVPSLTTKHFWAENTISATSNQPFDITRFSMGTGRILSATVVDPILAVQITIAGDAPAAVRFHIYDFNHDLIAESANIPATSIGTLECVFTGETLSPGLYYFGVRLVLEGSTTNPSAICSHNTTTQGGTFWDWLSLSRSHLPEANNTSDLLPNFYSQSGQNTNRYIPFVGIR